MGGNLAGRELAVGTDAEGMKGNAVGIASSSISKNLAEFQVNLEALYEAPVTLGLLNRTRFASR